ncbi:MAG: transcriptional regulator, TetR family [Marmoricola sp.]|nr:transcriptional regulator, TetR family [Marmoricola sp.]
MPRISDARPPVAPSSAGQRERHQRMLDAAVKLGSDLEFERVQMQDVASESGVAIATLYRYFPSKVHLFVAVMRAQLDQMDPSQYAVQPGQDRVDVTVDLLITMTDQMSRNRRLSMSMIQSMILVEGLDSRDSDTVERGFLELLLQVVGWGDEPSRDQRRRCWLLIQCWFGVLITTLSGNRPLSTAEADLRRACELLLGPDPDLSSGTPNL